MLYGIHCSAIVNLMLLFYLKAVVSRLPNEFSLFDCRLWADNGTVRRSFHDFGKGRPVMFLCLFRLVLSTVVRIEREKIINRIRFTTVVLKLHFTFEIGLYTSLSYYVIGFANTSSQLPCPRKTECPPWRTPNIGKRNFLSEMEHNNLMTSNYSYTTERN